MEPFFQFQWYPFDIIATAAWEAIDNLMQSMQGKVRLSSHFLFTLSNQPSLGPCKTWEQLSNMLTSKHLMSKKPLSIKRQLSSLNTEVGWIRKLIWIGVFTSEMKTCTGAPCRFDHCGTASKIPMAQ